MLAVVCRESRHAARPPVGRLRVAVPENKRAEAVAQQVLEMRLLRPFSQAAQLATRLVLETQAARRSAQIIATRAVAGALSALQHDIEAGRNSGTSSVILDGRYYRQVVALA